MLIRLSTHSIPERISAALTVDKHYELGDGHVIRKDDEGYYLVVSNALVLTATEDLPVVHGKKLSNAIRWVEISQHVAKDLMPGDYSQGMIRAWVVTSPNGGVEVAVSGTSYRSVAGRFMEILRGVA